jgi:hypothetical protein
MEGTGKDSDIQPHHKDNGYAAYPVIGILILALIIAVLDFVDFIIDGGLGGWKNWVNIIAAALIIILCIVIIFLIYSAGMGGFSDKQIQSEVKRRVNNDQRFPSGLESSLNLTPGTLSKSYGGERASSRIGATTEGGSNEFY